GGDRWARQQLELAAAWAPGGFGVRIATGCAVRPDDLPAAVDTVVLGRDAPWCAADLAGTRRVLVEVTGPGEARTAAAAGASGLIARGNEAGGPVGELTSFVLLQRLLAGDAGDLPVWVAGGIGPRSAAACVLGGAAGVVLDSQLALVAEAELPADLGELG